MKKTISGLLLIFFSVFANAQNGLENIIVEKYYISDSADAAAPKGGHLPAGSVTYRIYADLLPGYRFQAAYGVAGHELRIATSTSFFNNEEFGATTANDIPWQQLNNNTVMLDSWLSVGAGSAGNYGILKVEDDTARTVVNTDIPQVLQNANPLAGIPLKDRDGLKAASPQSVVSIFGIENEIRIFGNKNDRANGKAFSTTNGSWASFGGAIGPNPNNKVLIAQLTTDGALSFELNIQLGASDGAVENYVAKNPVGNEIQLSCLTYPMPVEKVSSNNNKKVVKNSKLKN
ncbi:MAG: hypothetical protein ABI723_18730 [Bacteroidia bacterium]